MEISNSMWTKGGGLAKQKWRGCVCYCVGELGYREWRGFAQELKGKERWINPERNS